MSLSTKVATLAVAVYMLVGRVIQIYYKQPWTKVCYNIESHVQYSMTLLSFHLKAFFTWQLFMHRQIGFFNTIPLDSMPHIWIPLDIKRSTYKIAKTKQSTLGTFLSSLLRSFVEQCRVLCAHILLPGQFSTVQIETLTTIIKEKNRNQTSKNGRTVNMKPVTLTLIA